MMNENNSNNNEENKIQENMNQISKMVNDKNKRKALFIKIFIPVVIVFIIAGIYFLKNYPEKPPAEPILPEYALDATYDFNLEEILSLGLPVMIDFGADSCQPCRQMAPVLEELNEELQGKAVIKFVDVWKNPDIAGGIPLRVIPTQFFFYPDGSPYVPPDAQSSNLVIYQHKDTGMHFFTAHEGGMDKNSILTILEDMGMK
jgi:thioredoxin 1